MYSYLALSLSPTTARFSESKPRRPAFETNNLHDICTSYFRINFTFR